MLDLSPCRRHKVNKEKITPLVAETVVISESEHPYPDLEMIAPYLKKHLRSSGCRWDSEFVPRNFSSCCCWFGQAPGLISQATIIYRWVF
jgi:hypothetical protein